MLAASVMIGKARILAKAGPTSFQIWYEIKYWTTVQPSKKYIFIALNN
jgi:hypothetical protein